MSWLVVTHRHPWDYNYCKKKKIILSSKLRIPSVTLAFVSSYSNDLLEAFHSEPNSFNPLALFHPDIALVMTAKALIALNQVYNMCKCLKSDPGHMPSHAVDLDKFSYYYAPSRVTTLTHLAGHTFRLCPGTPAQPSQLTRHNRDLAQFWSWP